MVSNQMNDKQNFYRKNCWDKAVYAFGTASVFEKRANSLRGYLRIKNFLGIGVPVAVGGIVISFGVQFKYLTEVLMAAGSLAVLQLVVSIWALVAKWEDRLAYSLGSISSNLRLSRAYKSLGSDPPDDLGELKVKFDMLELEDAYISDNDSKQGITEREKRRGMRAALREFQRECAGCGEVPKSLKPTDCDICGNF